MTSNAEIMSYEQWIWDNARKTVRAAAAERDRKKRLDKKLRKIARRKAMFPTELY